MSLSQRFAQNMMAVYRLVPAGSKSLLRKAIVRPAKRLLSRGLLTQEGFVLARRLDQSVPYAILREGSYEPALSALLRAWIRPGDIVIDIGANIGYFTLLAADRVGPEGSVIAFEPHPTTYRDLIANIALNGFQQVRAYQAAVGDSPGSLDLWYSPDTDSGLASFRRTSHELTRRVTVPVVTLDAACPPGVRAVKIDIEGAELLAFRGGRHLLASTSRPDLIAFESIASHAAAFGGLAADPPRLLTDCGYTIWQLVPGRGGFALAPAGEGDGTLIAVAPGVSPPSLLSR